MCGEFASFVAHFDFAEHEIAAASLHTGGDEHVALIDWPHESRVQGDGGHRYEAVHGVGDGNDHGGIGGGHEDLSAYDASGVLQMLRVR